MTMMIAPNRAEKHIINWVKPLFLFFYIEEITLPDIIDTIINVKVHPSSPAASEMEKKEVVFRVWIENVIKRPIDAYIEIIKYYAYKL